MKQLSGELSADFSPVRSSRARQLPRPRLGIVRRHIGLVAGCCLLVVAATVVFTRRAIPVYEGIATVRIDEKQPQRPAQDILYFDNSNAITTEIEMLRSRALAANVVDSLGLRLRFGSDRRPTLLAAIDDFVVSPRRRQRYATLGRVQVGAAVQPGAFVLVPTGAMRFELRALPSNRALGIVEPGQPTEIGGLQFTLAPSAIKLGAIPFEIVSLDEAVDDVQKALTINRRGRDTDLIEVRYEGTDAEQARDVPNALVATFIASRRTARQAETHATIVFLRSQLEQLAVQLRGAEDTLRHFRETAGVVSLSEQSSAVVRRHADLEAQRSALEIERDALATLLKETDNPSARGGANAAATFQRLVGFPTLLRNQAVSVLLGALTTAEGVRSELLQRRRETDPDVILQTNRIREIEDHLIAIGAAYVDGLSGQLKVVETEIHRSAVQRDEIPAKEVQFARLDRSARILDGIFTLFQSRLKEAELAEAVEDPSVRLVDTAVTPRKPVRPRLPMNIALAIAAGLALGTGLAMLLEHGDKSVHTRDELRDATGLAVLATIPRGARARRYLSGTAVDGVRQAFGLRRLTAGAADTPEPAGLALPDGAGPIEAYQRLATNLSFARPTGSLRVITITSPMPGEGKTTCAINLAATLARRHQRVLLIDADMRKGTVGSALGLARGPGLAEVLAGTRALGESIRSVSLSDGATMSVLSSGEPSGRAGELLGSEAVRQTLDSLRSAYDVVVVDAPPINLFVDAAFLASCSDGLIIVARAARTTPNAIAFAMEQLNAVRAPVIGALLNDVDFRRGAHYDQSHEYLDPARYYAPAN